MLRRMDSRESVLLPQLASSTDFTNPASVDSLKNTRTCTHTHTCNPPAPDACGHIHTCYHTHTRVFTPREDGSQEMPPTKKSKRPLGNREAVRKYREKKKAHTAYLEEEVKKLLSLNQQLVRKLQGQATLEAEISGLRGLLLDLRGKIDNEVGVFPFQKTSDTNESKEGDCRVRCEIDLPCLHPHDGLFSQTPDGTGKILVSWGENCHPPSMDCGVKMGDNIVRPNGHTIDRVETLVSSASQDD